MYIFSSRTFSFSLIAVCAAAISGAEPLLTGFAGRQLRIDSGAAALSPDGASLTVDASGGSGGFRQILSTRPGVLKPDTDYCVRLQYRIDNPVTDADPITEHTAGGLSKFYFYFQAASLRNEPGSKTMDISVNRRTPTPVTLRFRTAKVADPVFRIMAEGKLKGELRDFRLTEGKEVTFRPAEPQSKAYSGVLPALPAGAEEFQVDLPRNAAVIRVEEHGILPENPDNSPALNKLLASCRKTPGTRLIFPAGTYYFRQGLIFRGLRDFELDGGGAKFINHVRNRAFANIRDGERIRLHNFTVDWNYRDDPLTSLAELAEVGKDFYVLKFFQYQTFPVRKNLLISAIQSYPAPYETPDSFAHGFYGRPKPEFKWLSGNELRIAETPHPKMKRGNRVQIKHYYYSTQKGGVLGIYMENNRHLTLENLTIHGNASQLFSIDGNQQYTRLAGIRTVPPEGEYRPFVTTADTLILRRSLGFLKIENCEFSFSGDDFINVKDNSGYVEKTGPNTLLAVVLRGVEYYRPGQLIELRNTDFSPTGFKAELKEIRKNGKFHELLFNVPLPDPKLEGFILFNHAYRTRNIIIRNNTFHDGYCRGILVEARDVTIENNRILRTKEESMRIETGFNYHAWCEGYGVDNVVVRGNIFERSCRDPNVTRMQGGRFRDIFIGFFAGRYHAPAATAPGSPAIRNILFENNTFRESIGYIAYISSAENVIFRNNTFLNETPRGNSPFRGSFFVTDSSGVYLINNRWIDSPHVKRPGVAADAASVRNLVAEGNRLDRK